MDSVLKEAKAKYEGKVQVIKVNIEEEKNYKLAVKYNIRLMPTIMFFDENRQVKGRYEGLLDMSQIDKIVSSMGVK